MNEDSHLAFLAKVTHNDTYNTSICFFHRINSCCTCGSFFIFHPKWKLLICDVHLIDKDLMGNPSNKILIVWDTVFGVDRIDKS